ncbi:hypothetical protein E2562_006513 [Oryza meyeriana var. granulata]|uniref:Uncharacterized protein n=1 Tax=Oryza meyeriana var. granulata TaxID=110450 RepID=A0A6G1CMN6_9ORYZ|nr:hypothetical protein E2562_006513 [Oryza meyeriana var. granulata]
MAVGRPGHSIRCAWCRRRLQDLEVMLLLHQGAEGALLLQSMVAGMDNHGRWDPSLLVRRVARRGASHNAATNGGNRTNNKVEATERRGWWTLR